jgi:hypothetical protein
MDGDYTDDKGGLIVAFRKHESGLEIDFNYWNAESSKGKDDAICIENENGVIAISVEQAQWLVDNLPDIIEVLR